MRVGWRARIIPILIAAALLVPHVLHLERPVFMDEHITVVNALNFVANKTLIPSHASYPTLYFFLATPFVAAGAAAEVLLGHADSLRHAVAGAVSDNWWPLVIGPRILSLSILVLGALFAYRYCKGARGAVAGALVAGAMVTSPSLLMHGTYALPDILVFALSLLAFGLQWSFLERPNDTRLLLWSAAAAGLAMSAKYNGIAAALPLVWVVLSLRSPTNRTWGWAVRLLALCGACFLVGFLLGSPGWIIAPQVFVRDLSFEMQHAKLGQIGSYGVPLLGQLELLITTNPLICGCALLGALSAWRTPESGDRLAIVSFVCAWVLAATSTKQSVQYLYPAFPALLYWVALAPRTLSVVGTVNGARLLAIAVFAMGIKGWYDGVLLSRPHTTELARTWIYSHIPSERTIANDWAYVPKLHSKREVTEMPPSEFGGEGKWVARKLAREHVLYDIQPIDYSSAWLNGSNAPDYIVTSSDVYDRFFSSGLFTRRPPAAEHPEHATFVKKRDFYTTLFVSKRWKSVLDTDTGNGPRTRVFQRAD